MAHYEEEILGPSDDDGTMVESRKALAEAVIGHRIVKVEKNALRPGYDPETWYPGLRGTAITLDNGKRVFLIEQSDCCAYTELESFLLHPDKVDHVIVGVGTTEGYTKWHIYADMGDVLELTVGWSCGNPFYYCYGFVISVEDAEEA